MTPGVVLIDELDLHLHPKWQRRIVEALRRTFPALQFIASTHSPFIIQGLREGQIINLDDREQPEKPPVYNEPVEDIVEDVQGVENPRRSRRHQELTDAAKEYYATLKDAEEMSTKDRRTAKKKLDIIMERFSDDPASAALLAFKRRASRLDD